MTEAQWKKVAALLGLGVRARTVIVGVEQVRGAVMKGKVEIAVVAGDASENSRAKIVPLLTAKHVQMVDGVSAADLGSAVGRETTAVVAVVDAGLARGVRRAVAPAAS